MIWKYNYYYKLIVSINKTYMKKSPIKVIIRLRPTSNFAHQQLTIDEQTGYQLLDSDKFQSMSRGL